MKKELKKLTEADIKQKGVQALSNTPARRSSYGESGLTPEQIKAWHDKLPAYIGELLNGVIDAIGGKDAGDYITVGIDGKNMTLSELMEAITDGSLAGLLSVKVDGQLNALNKVIANLYEKYLADIEYTLFSGEGEQSAVQGAKDGSTENIAYAERSVSLGINSVAGSRAFRLLGYNSTAKTYTLDSTEGIVVGDEYSIFFRQRRSRFGKITAISGNTITVDNHFLPSGTDSTNAPYLESAYIYISGKPTIGTVSIGRTARASGLRCLAAEEASDAGGVWCISDGRGAFTRGMQNVAGYMCAAFGQECINLGLKGFAAGQELFVAPGVECAAVFGMLNQILANYGFAAGYGNVVTKAYQTLVGKYAANTSALFGVGSGTGDNDRKNAFTVFGDGHGEIASVSASKRSVVNVGYLDDKLGPVEKALDDLQRMLDDKLGTVEKALDGLLEIQERLIGGDSE